MALLVSNFAARCRVWLNHLSALRLAVLMLVTATAVHGAAPALPKSEVEVKADYLYLFSKYVEWPAPAFTDTNHPVVVAVLGDDALAAALERRVDGRATQGGRKLVVLRARRLADLDVCHIVFIGQGERGAVREIVEALRARAVLTVCDQDGLFAQQGLMIKFALSEGRVRFEVKIEPVERAGLSIHSEMLGAAKRVWPKARTSLEPP